MPEKRVSKSVRQRKKVRRKRMSAFLYRFLCLLVLVVAGFLAVTVFFKVSVIRISGETRYSDSELLSAVHIKTGDNLFFINKFAIINNLFDKFVYLDEIRIRRRLPSTIEVSVTECVPVAAVNQADTYYLVDKKGKILEKTTSAKAGKLPKIQGIDLNGVQIGQNLNSLQNERVEPLFQFIDQLDEKKIISKVNYINVDKLYDVRMGYQGRFDVYFGNMEDMERKLRFLLSVEKRLSPSDKGIIDLTDEKKAYFRPQTALPPVLTNPAANADKPPNAA